MTPISSIHSTTSKLKKTGSNISYVQSVKYLGVCFKAGKLMSCNFDIVKKKFYRPLNSIYSHSYSANSELVTIELFKAYCLPVLLYAVEVLPLRASDFRSLDNCINVVVAKVFKLSSNDNVQVAAHIWPLAHSMQLNTVIFYSSNTAVRKPINVKKAIVNYLHTVATAYYLCGTVCRMPGVLSHTYGQ